MSGKKITKKAVMDALSGVYDPEIPLNIVDLGLIYKIDVGPENNVEVDMTMTTKGCPMHAFITQQAEKEIKKLEGAGRVKVNLVWNPPWTPERISRQAKEKFQDGEQK
ncbi:MAG: metal-sulfur cluster assembly factor [Actinomycetota bacterium]